MFAMVEEIMYHRLAYIQRRPGKTEMRHSELSVEVEGDVASFPVTPAGVRDQSKGSTNIANHVT